MIVSRWVSPLGVPFQAVVSTVTDRVLMPLIAWVFGEPDFDQLLTFRPVGEDGTQISSVGAVLTALVDFRSLRSRCS